MSGPVIVVTGAGSGIGLACARQLLAADWSLALFDRDEGALKRALDELDVGPRIIALPVDVSDERGVENAMEKAAAFGPIRASSIPLASVRASRSATPTSRASAKFWM